MRTKTLTLSGDYIRYFRELPSAKGTMPRGWVCEEALRDRVELPADCNTIRLCLTKDEPDNDGIFDLRISVWSPLIGVRAELTPDFRMWLNQGQTDGYRYFYIDYEVTP